MNVAADQFGSIDDLATLIFFLTCALIRELSCSELHGVNGATSRSWPGTVVVLCNLDHPSLSRWGDWLDIRMPLK
jgi:hypothetical protein